MEIVIHGTKGGRQIFTPKKLGGLLDISSDASNASAIGKEAYAIRFVENSIIFSKYKIIRDVRGDKRTGFLAFSLFLPHNQKLSGSDIISLLNEVSKEYCQKYIPENDNNLNDVREDWTFLDRIYDDYKKKLLPVTVDDFEKILSGIEDDAFIYYRNDEELQKYFNNPNKEEYRKYRQILFVKGELKGELGNPLNALRHSEDDLTEKIDLENPKYKLIYNQTSKGGVLINVKVNGFTRSSKSKINRQDILEISWTKKYCKTIPQKGKWYEISNDYIDVNETSESVTIKEIIPPEDTKTITFKTKDWKDSPVNNAKIFCKSADSEKTVDINNQIIFKGEELGKRWIVFAAANNNSLLSVESQIDFERVCPEDACSLDIILNKHKLNITIHKGSLNGDTDPIQEYNISKTEFFDAEIEKPHLITVERRGFKPHSFNYRPLISDINQHIYLQREQADEKTKPTQIYEVDPGDHGKLKDGYSYTSKHKNGNDVKYKIIPNKGYRFTGFREQTGKLIAQYEKQEDSKLIVVAIVAAIVAIFCIVLISNWGTLSNLFDGTNTGGGQPIVDKTTAGGSKPNTGNKPTSDTKVSGGSNTTTGNKSTSDTTATGGSKTNTGNKPSSSTKAMVGSKTTSPDTTNKRGTQQNVESNNVKSNNLAEEDSQSSNNKKSITPSLNSDVVTINDLTTFNDKATKQQKRSINLYLDFWSYVKDNKQKAEFDNLLDKVKIDINLMNSELKKFLNNICSTKEKFDKYNKASGKSTCKTINELRKKIP